MTLVSQDIQPFAMDAMTDSLSSDPLSLYMRDVEQYRLLTQEEEYALAGSARQGNRQAATRLTECNLRLVVAFAYRYRSLLPSHHLMDLIQEGNLGLMRAVELFDPDKGYRFSTYASWHIGQRMLRYASTMKLPIHLAIRASQDLFALRRADFDLQVKLEREPTREELATATKLTQERVENVYPWLSTTYSSLDEPLKEGCDLLQGELIADPEDAYEVTEAALDGHELVEACLACLKPSERKVVEMYYGLHGETQCENFMPIAQAFQVSRQYVRQLHADAISRMRRRLPLLIDLATRVS